RFRGVTRSLTTYPCAALIAELEILKLCRGYGLRFGMSPLLSVLLVDRYGEAGGVSLQMLWNRIIFMTQAALIPHWLSRADNHRAPPISSSLPLANIKGISLPT